MYMSFDGLNDLERGARSWNMIQVMGGHQLLIVHKQLQKFMKWWLETVE